MSGMNGEGWMWASAVGLYDHSLVFKGFKGLLLVVVRQMSGPVNP
jgi:hypothetical protein